MFLRWNSRLFMYQHAGPHPGTQFSGWKYVRLAARGPPTDWGWFVQADDAKAFFQVSPATLPMIDIHRP